MPKPFTHKPRQSHYGTKTLTRESKRVWLTRWTGAVPVVLFPPTEPSRATGVPKGRAAPGLSHWIGRCEHERTARQLVHQPADMRAQGRRGESARSLRFPISEAVAPTIRGAGCRRHDPNRSCSGSCPSAGAVYVRSIGCAVRQQRAQKLPSCRPGQRSLTAAATH
jgi:hypothetical protein